MNSRFKQTLLQLLHKTSAGVLKWQETADDHAFRIGLGDGIIRIERRFSYGGQNEDYIVRLFGITGREVESASSENEEDFDFLPGLFESARRSALDIDGLLDTIEKDIEAGKSIRIQDSTPSADEDIPF